MLLSLHMKNLALIEEEEVFFPDGLNILTGETGAGKSILIGSIGLALGGRADRGVIRTGADHALIELAFQADSERQLAKLAEMEIEPDEDSVINIRRRIYPARSQCAVNGVTVPLRQLRELGELLIDICGQRENQRLLRRQTQRQILDEFAGAEDARLLSQVREHYNAAAQTRRALEEIASDPSARAREMDLLAYEISEIEGAAVRDGEEEELEAQFRRLSSFRKISEAVQSADYLLQGGNDSAAEQIARAGRDLSRVGGIDEELDGIAAQISQIDSLLSDAARSLSDYREGLTFDPGELSRIEERLDLIHHLEGKYGPTAQAIGAALKERQARLSRLEDYESERARLEQQLAQESERLREACRALSAVRMAAAEELRAAMTRQLLDLNFRQVEFRVEVVPDEEKPSADGWDEVSFVISMNPGEPVRPLEEVASGGELSRILLALKTVFAGKDDIHTLIFDEIDTGISGQTAWKAAQKMHRLAGDHQILCITHLPQIAAMEDRHFLIEKTVEDGRTRTHIRPLTEEESTAELARMSGGDVLTEAALENAAQMKARRAAQGSDQP